MISGAVRGTQGRSSGLLYFEIAVVKGTLTTIGIGVAKSSYSLGGTSLEFQPGSRWNT